MVKLCISEKLRLETVNLGTFDPHVLGLTVNHHFVVAIAAGEVSPLRQVDDEIEAIRLEGLVELGEVLTSSVLDHEGPRPSFHPRVARQVKVGHPPCKKVLNVVQLCETQKVRLSHVLMGYTLTHL